MVRTLISQTYILIIKSLISSTYFSVLQLTTKYGGSTTNWFDDGALTNNDIYILFCHFPLYYLLLFVFYTDNIALPRLFGNLARLSVILDIVLFSASHSVKD